MEKGYIETLLHQAQCEFEFLHRQLLKRIEKKAAPPVAYRFTTAKARAELDILIQSQLQEEYLSQSDEIKRDIEAKYFGGKSKQEMEAMLHHRPQGLILQDHLSSNNN